MIEEYSLKLLCDKYGVSKENIVNKNNNILSKGEYEDIDKTLDYLINELKVSRANIEKCPSILYRNVDAIKDNIDFLKQKNLVFSSIESCLHVLSSEPDSLKDTYDYVEENYGKVAINKNTSVLSCPKDLVIAVEELGLNKDWNLSIANTIKLGFTTLDEIKSIINSKEFKEHKELFTSTTLAHANIDDIKRMIHSEEFSAHPELFTSETLAHAKIEDIKKMIHSEEFKEYPELFTSQTLARARIEDIQGIIYSEEFKEHKELFTSQTLAYAKLEDIKKMIHSEEFKKHPELFTSTTLAHARIKDIQEMIHSEEFSVHPELFTSETLAHAKIEDIQKLLEMPYWNDIRYKDLLTSSVAAKSKQMITKLPVLFKMAEYYKIDGYLNTSFLLFSPSQNFALINYLNDNNIPLIENDKLNMVFGKQPGFLKKKYGIDIKEQMLKYDFSKFSFDEDTKKGGKKNAVR